MSPRSLWERFSLQKRHREEAALFLPLDRVSGWSTGDCCRYSGTRKGTTLKEDVDTQNTKQKRGQAPGFHVIELLH